MSEAEHISRVDFWNMKRGQRTVYHRGFLAEDREKNPSVCDSANVAWELAQKGVLLLVQRRIGNMDYEYIAQRL